MKKFLIGMVSILCMHSSMAQQDQTNPEGINNKQTAVNTNKPNDNAPPNLNMSYKINIEKNVGDKKTTYQGHFVSGSVSYFNEMNIVTYIAQNKCNIKKECDIVKGTENVGVGYIVDMFKPEKSKDEVVLLLQINEKSMTNLRKFCENEDKNCVDMFDISVVNFKQTLKMQENQPKTVQYNNVTYTITLNKE